MRHIKKLLLLLLVLISYHHIHAQSRIIQSKYPKLTANIFMAVDNTNDALKELLMYDIVLTGTVVSAPPLGSPLGVFSGLGSFNSLAYNLNNTVSGSIPQGLNYNTQLQSDSILYFAHKGLRHIEANSWFETDKSDPGRWFNDRISPKWFAYTVLETLVNPVTSNPTDTVFVFDIIAAKMMYRALKVKDIPDTLYWTSAPDSLKYLWTYLCFKDNDSSANRGCFEIMAIKRVDTLSGEVVVAQKKVDGVAAGRTIYGMPQSYSQGHRAGLLSHSSIGFGSPAFLMNLYSDTTDASYEIEMKANGVDWIGACEEYVENILMKSAVGGTYLCDGVELDADGEIWKPYGFHLGDPTNQIFGYQLDLDWDGQIDSLDSVNAWLPNTYHEYSQQIYNAADNMGRDFHIIMNGHIEVFPTNINGRRFEDFNGGFNESYQAAINQYLKLNNESNTIAPGISAISERDRDTAEMGLINFKEHRHIMALVTVLGEGFYGHTGAHATHIGAWGDWGSTGPWQVGEPNPEDWFDEFSVDISTGESSKYKYPDGNSLHRLQNSRWLGLADSSGFKIDSIFNSNQNIWLYTFMRTFENGVVLYSQYPHTLYFDTTYYSINGADPKNDGASVDSIVFNVGFDGIFLLKRSTVSAVLQKEENGEMTIKVYPNPANKSLTIDFHLTDYDDVVLSIYNINGVLLDKHQFKSLREGNHQKIISIDHLLRGMYFLQIKTNKSQQIIKLIVNR